MTLPTTFEAIAIIALIFVPCIIFGQLIQRTIAHFPESFDGRHFLGMVASGLFLHVLAFPFWTRNVVDWYISDSISEHWISTYLWFLVVIFVWPVVAGVMATVVIPIPWVDRQLDKVGMSYIDRTPTAWDFAVLPEEGTWVKVFLKERTADDRELPIAGVFGKRSFASLYRRRQDIFLQEIYDLDDDEGFADPVVDNIGVWIAQDSIERIEFYRLDKRQVVGESDESRLANAGDPDPVGYNRQGDRATQSPIGDINT